MMTTESAASSLLPIDLDGLPRQDLAEWLETMLLIRELELACDPLAISAKVIGGIHSSQGQEAVAVGSIRALEPTDIVAGSHRSHHHALARGLDPNRVMAELYGKATGVSEGRGGTMHMRDLSLGYWGGNGIVGAGVGLALGAALAEMLQKRPRVALGFVGDGGMNTGRTLEFINLAVVWHLPLIVICENNLYAVETPSVRMTGGGSIVRRAEGFGIRASSVDGQDVGAIHRATVIAREHALAGGGPTFIEAQTYRYEGHSTGQVIKYRTKSELDTWRLTRDPIERLREAMRLAGLLSDEAYASLQRRVKARIEEAIAFAEGSPNPDPEDAMRDVTGLDLRVRSNV